jgi:predicted nucleotidyltransferase
VSREDEILAQIKQGLQQFADELQGYRIVLFGSRASGQQRQRSDFDFGIVGASPVPLKTFFRIADFLEKLPTLYRIDWVDLNRATESLRKNALLHAKVIYG